MPNVMVARPNIGGTLCSTNDVEFTQNTRTKTPLNSQARTASKTTRGLPTTATGRTGCTVQVQVVGVNVA